MSKEKLANRFSAFSRGEWFMLLESSARCDEQAVVARRRRRHQGDDLQKRAVRVELKVALGELSSARQVLEGEAVASGTRETLRSLTDESKRLSRLRDPIPREILDHSPPVPFVQDRDKFLNVRGEKRGSKRTLRDDRGTFRPLIGHGARANITHHRGHQDWMTAFRKANGGVRGIVVGDVVRRLVARTITQQLGPQVEAATAPFQFALSTRAGSECVAHVVQGLCEVNPDSTVMSIDGLS